MSVKHLKPITPGQRFKVINKYKNENHVAHNKLLFKKKCKTGGRNNYGKMTMRYIGGGHKKKYRIIDYKRNKFKIPAIVKSIEYDPNRSSLIALLYYKDGEKKYIISLNGLKVGDELISGESAPSNLGNSMHINNIPLGTYISCIELNPGKGAIIARSAGSYCQLISKSGNHANIKFPSGEIRMILLKCMATIGVVSNLDHQLQKSGKAGRNRWLGRRPRTRGVAMNPVDHPMGGGEGKSSGGHPRSRNGIPSKGFKTRSNKKHSNRYIVEYRKK